MGQPQSEICSEKCSEQKIQPGTQGQKGNELYWKRRNEIACDFYTTLDQMSWHHVKKLQGAYSNTAGVGQIQFKRWDKSRLKL